MSRRDGSSVPGGRGPGGSGPGGSGPGGSGGAAAVTRHTVLALAAFAMLFPLLWALSGSFKPGTDVYSSSPFPVPGTLENYRYALHEFPIGRLLLNTFITAIGVTALHLAAGVLAAWSFVRFAHRGQGVLLAAVTVALVVPPQTLIIPHFLMITEVGLRDTFVGLVVPQLSHCALAVLLLREHTRSIPPTLIAAASLDGASPFETLRHIVLPLLRPALGAVGIVVFITTWNEYLWPSLAAPSPEHTTIQMGLQLFETSEGPEHGPMLAAAMLATVPVIVAYLLASRRIADAFLQAGLR
ncbi:ABC transporter permease [Parafrankia colletiae]|uniref:ABC transporter permease n=1 Tax=Parafrankia colletiae TaxID=573497 RepID=A0A1S1QHP2_9ACTN|nr:carbohydrate ABC transporter permease [Parafrankia colletiae]MCK9899934.1 carbohydrate ABC transporter permease [Frankia sp. Cpl3]OHV34288.1 ABC transporter permease [Parafrankia colletiae]